MARVIARRDRMCSKTKDKNIIMMGVWRDKSGLKPGVEKNK